LETTRLNTVVGNVKSALHGTAPTHKLSTQHLPRYLADFCYRFNRRFDLAAMLPRLGYAAAHTPPMPYRLLKLAEAHWYSGQGIHNLSSRIQAKLNRDKYRHLI
jgi:hypothetical protein